MSITSEGMGITNTIRGIAPLKINESVTPGRSYSALGDGTFSSVFRSALETAQAAISPYASASLDTGSAAGDNYVTDNNDKHITSAAPGTARTSARRYTGSGAADDFITSIFKDAIQNVRDTDAEFVNAQYLLSTGQLDNPAELNIAAYKNEIAVDLLIQLRNKALDSYNQLISMNV